MRFMKRVLIFCFVALLVFTIFACVFQCATGQELSPTLVQWYYTVFGIELGSVAFLKIVEIIKEERGKRLFKKKRKNKPYEYEDNESENINERPVDTETGSEGDETDDE